MFFHLDAWEYFGLFHPLCQPFLKFGLSPAFFLFLGPLAYLATGCTVYTLKDASDLCGDGFSRYHP